MAAPRFVETQHFRMGWTWGVVLLVSGVAWWAFVEQILLGRPFGSNPGSDALVWGLLVLCGIGLPILFVLARLTITVTDDALAIRYAPFLRRSLGAADIRAAEAVSYRPIREWGGWGIRGWGGRRAYTARGTQGVRLDLADGSTLLLGSGRPHELEAAVRGMIGA